MQKLSRSIIALGGLAVLAACGDDVSVTPPTPPPAPTVTAVTVSPNSATVRVGEKVILSANVEVNGSGVNTAVTWTSANAAIATVTATGEVTGVAAGTTTIRAASVANAGVSGSAAITVSADRGVQSVSVAPTSAILAPGQTLQAAATVNLTAGSSAARTVTWTTSSAAVATVSSTGTITAVAPGSATITATSTADNTVSAPLALTVRAPAPATISIQSITAGGLGAPVNIANVGGQIEVSLNVDPGDQVISKVDILIDNAVVYTQSFTSAQSQEMSLAAVAEALATIVGSINTADFNAATGVARYLNGPRLLSARATVVGGSQVATPSLTLQFNNANRVIETMTYAGTTATATSPTGLLFQRGALNVSVLPVIYASGISMTAGTATFGGCDASGIGARTAALTAPAGGTGAWTASFAQTGTAGAGNVVNYEYNCVGAGENATVTATDNQGNQLFAATAPFGTPAAPAQVVRLDNRAPGAPTFVANPNGRQNGWINATVGLTGLNTSATDNDWLANGAADAGVGAGSTASADYIRMLRYGATMAAAVGAAGSATPTLPAPSTTNTSICFVASAADKLGNESALPASSTTCLAPPAGSFVATGSIHLQGGVDIAAPTIAFSGASVPSNARINAATVGTEFQVTVADTGAVGNSGMLAGTPVAATVTVRNAAGTTGCLAGTVVSGVCTASGTGMTPALPLVATNAVAASTTLGYYTFTGYAQDAAGNASGTVTRVVVRDNTPAVATNPSVPVAITGAFNAAAFLNDDLSIRDYYYTVGYAGIGTFPAATLTLAAAPTAVDAYNAATLTNTNFAINTTVNTFLGLQDGTAGAPLAFVGAGAGSAPLNALNLFVRDQTQPADSLGTSPVAPTPPAAGVSITNFTNYAAATSNATICAGTLVGGCGATPITTNLTAVATGATAVFNNPFSRVDFYGFNGTDYVLLGSVAAGSATLVDNGATRVWTYTFALSGSAAGTALGTGVTRDIRAFGVSSSGTVALVSAGVAQTINP